VNFDDRHLGEIANVGYRKVCKCAHVVLPPEPEKSHPILPAPKNGDKFSGLQDFRLSGGCHVNNFPGKVPPFA
jgi:hypothetical protein